MSSRSWESEQCYTSIRDGNSRRNADSDRTWLVMHGPRTSEHSKFGKMGRDAPRDLTVTGIERAERGRARVFHLDLRSASSLPTITSLVHFHFPHSRLSSAFSLTNSNLPQSIALIVHRNSLAFCSLTAHTFRPPAHPRSPPNQIQPTTASSSALLTHRDNPSNPSTWVSGRSKTFATRPLSHYVLWSATTASPPQPAYSLPAILALFPSPTPSSFKAQPRSFTSVPLS